MLRNFRPDPARHGYATRVGRALGWPRVAAVALVALLLSLGVLVNPGLLDFHSPLEVVRAWFEHLLELLLIGAALLLGYTLADAALPRHVPGRLVLLCAWLFGLAVLLTLLLHGYYARGFQHLPPPLRLLSDSLRWGLPAVILALVADVQRRAWHAHAAASAAEQSRAQLQQAEGQQRLAALQAQIEPHFLFNVLGNVRLLYRTEPQAGAEAIACLMRYLRGALPQLRSTGGSLGDELDLVQAYLALFQVRMGARLQVSIDAAAHLRSAEFPPMLLLTLVENAIQHGLEPAGGGHLQLQAVGRQGRLQVAVLDDGAGFSATPSSGTGLGLGHVRRQLAARYAEAGRLQLQARHPRGAAALLSIPWHDAAAAA